jgi:hypothetical protein
MRSDYTGFTIQLFGYSIEFVFYHHRIVTAAIWHNVKLIKRIGA